MADSNSRTAARNKLKAGPVGQNPGGIADMTMPSFTFPGELELDPAHDEVDAIGEVCSLLDSALDIWTGDDYTDRQYGALFLTRQGAALARGLEDLLAKRRKESRNRDESISTKSTASASNVVVIGQADDVDGPPVAIGRDVLRTLRSKLTDIEALADAAGCDVPPRSAARLCDVAWQRAHEVGEMVDGMLGAKA